MTTAERLIYPRLIEVQHRGRWRAGVLFYDGERVLPSGDDLLVVPLSAL